MRETLTDLSDAARKDLDRARLLGVERDRVLWPNTSPPNWSDEQHAMASAQRSLSKYVRHLQAHTEDLGDRWHEDLAGGHEFADGSTLAVTLDDVEAWRAAKYQEAYNRRSQVKEVYLSVAYTRELLRQANAVAHESGLVKTPEERELSEK